MFSSTLLIKIPLQTQISARVFARCLVLDQNEWGAGAKVEGGSEGGGEKYSFEALQGRKDRVLQLYWDGAKSSRNCIETNQKQETLKTGEVINLMIRFLNNK